MQAVEETRSERRALRRLEKRSEWAEWLRALVFALVVAVLLRTFLFEITTVDGHSMQNTLFDAQRVLVDKSVYYYRQPRRFEVVICRYPGEDATFVKRVIGLPGDDIEIRNCVLYINDRPVDEGYIDDPAIEDFGPAKVPADAYFVMGDNRNRSTDSRYDDVGPIPQERILGRAIAVAWPLAEAHLIDHQRELDRMLLQERPIGAW